MINLMNSVFGYSKNQKCYASKNTNTIGTIFPPPQENIDDMTNLKNKKCLLETIDKLKNSDKNFSIAMVDMDNFKSINELFGYKTGDEFITKIGKTIKESNLDAYRFGGDEFIILFSENESKTKQEDSINNLLKNINSTLNSHPIKNIYTSTAQEKLDKLSKTDEKIKKLQRNQCGRDILLDFKKNCKTEEARNDDYLFSKLTSYNDAISSSYNNLLKESIEDEKQTDKRNMLKEMRLKCNSYGNLNLSKKEKNELDEYLIDKYDKTANISRIKSWQNDFNKNNGFCATCAIVAFDKNYIKNKEAKDLIAETGKVLQSGKDEKKGQYYFKSINNIDYSIPSFGKGINVKIAQISQYREKLELERRSSSHSLKMLG